MRRIDFKRKIKLKKRVRNKMKEKEIQLSNGQTVKGEVLYYYKSGKMGGIKLFSPKKIRFTSFEIEFKAENVFFYENGNVRDGFLEKTEHSKLNLEN